MTRVVSVHVADIKARSRRLGMLARLLNIRRHVAKVRRGRFTKLRELGIFGGLFVTGKNDESVHELGRARELQWSGRFGTIEWLQVRRLRMLERHVGYVEIHLLNVSR